MAWPVGPKHAIGPGLGRNLRPDRSNGPGLGREKYEISEGLARRPDNILARRAGLGQKNEAQQSGQAWVAVLESGFLLARPGLARQHAQVYSWLHQMIVTSNICFIW
jgi:hypothetical protein